MSWVGMAATSAGWSRRQCSTVLVPCRTTHAGGEQAGHLIALQGQTASQPAGRELVSVAAKQRLVMPGQRAVPRKRNANAASFTQAPVINTAPTSQACVCAAADAAGVIPASWCTFRSACAVKPHSTPNAALALPRCAVGARCGWVVYVRRAGARRRTVMLTGSTVMMQKTARPANSRRPARTHARPHAFTHARTVSHWLSQPISHACMRGCTAALWALWALAEATPAAIRPPLPLSMRPRAVRGTASGRAAAQPMPPSHVKCGCAHTHQRRGCEGRWRHPSRPRRSHPPPCRTAPARSSRCTNSAASRAANQCPLHICGMGRHGGGGGRTQASALLRQCLWVPHRGGSAHGGLP